MLFFGRKKNRDEEEDGELDDGKLPSRRKFKDLNPEDKPRRKSPPKPWGKRERFLILFVVLFTTLTSAFLAASSRKWKLPGLPKLQKPNLNFEQTIVLENNKKQNYDYTKQFEDGIAAKTKDLSGIYGVYVVDLQSSNKYGFNQDEQMQAASLIKLPVMALTFKLAEEGSLDLSTKYTLKTSDKILGSGSLYGKPEGTQITYLRLLEYMGKESDNTAFGIMRKILGDGQIDEYIKQIGLSQTDLSQNLTSPKDVGKFFEDLWEGRLLNEVNRQILQTYLTDTIWEEWVPKFIPEYKVAHKFGREVHVINDAGIVFATPPYTLVIMSDGIIDQEALVALPEIIKFSNKFIADIRK